MTKDFSGKRVITGTQGTIYWDGEPVIEVTEFMAEVELERSDVYVGMDKDSKMNGIAGTLSFSIDQVYTRSAAILKELKAGRDPRVMISGLLKDPDAVEGQQERVNIANCWFNKFPLSGFTKGEHNKQQYELGFRVTMDSEFADAIL